VDRFIRNINKTGAIACCSEDVANVLTQRANLAGSKTVVELGSGTGAITKKLIEHIPKEALFLALELNEHFVEETRKCCPSAIVYHDTAENVKHYLNKHGKETCDCVISTLPWTLFDKELQERILNAIWDVLPEGGEFLTVAYTFAALLPAGRRFRSLIEKRFVNVERTKPIWKNLPPVYVYHCKK
jgi:phosphatidylethanolamine/phosphatidyl-N-methylethanolamine N-methyltransferase